MFHVERVYLLNKNCEKLFKMNSEKTPYLSCIDYTVSNKKFDLRYNADYDMLETFPQPEVEELDLYYQLQFGLQQLRFMQ